MAAHYLIDAANAMVGALEFVEEDGRRKLHPHSLFQYLATACKALRFLVQDKELLQAIRSLESWRPEKWREMREFFQVFVKLDKGLMLEAGMHPSMVGYLFQDTEYILKVLSDDIQFVSTTYEFRLLDLATTVCHEAEFMELKYKPAPTLRRSIYVIGGASIIGVNAGADLVSAVPWISAVSQAFGGVLIGKGFS